MLAVRIYVNFFNQPSFGNYINLGNEKKSETN